MKELRGFRKSMEHREMGGNMDITFQVKKGISECSKTGNHHTAAKADCNVTTCQVHIQEYIKG